MANPVGKAAEDAAEDVGEKSKWWEFFNLDFLKQLISMLGLDLLFNEWKKKTAGKTADVVTDKMFCDERAKIIDDMRIMETANPPINIDNLWRRMKGANDDPNVTEHRFFALLSKTIADQENPKRGRQDTLKWLNDMDDEKFNLALNGLEDNRFVQWFNVARYRTKKVIQGWGTAIRERFGAGAGRIQAVFSWIGRQLERFANWLTEGPFPRFILMVILLVLAGFFLTLLVQAFRPRSRRERLDPLWRFSTFLGLGFIAGILALMYFLWAPAGYGLIFTLVLVLTAFVVARKYSMIPGALLFLAVGLATIWLLNLSDPLISPFAQDVRAKIANAEKDWAQGSAKEKEKPAAGKPETPPAASNQTPPTRTADAKARELADAKAKKKADIAAMKSSGGSNDAGAGTNSETKNPTSPPLAYIFPQGDHGIIEPAGVSCRSTDGDEKVCWGVLFNNDTIAHGVFLMDSVVSVHYGGENRMFNSQFPVMTFGGGLKFAGTSDFAKLTPDAGKSPDDRGTNFTFSFREPRGGLKSVDIVLTYKTVADSINHTVTITGIPVVQNQL